MSRPEHSHAPDIFYDAAEAKKYSTSSRMLSIQKEITKRALELLNLGNSGPQFLLDVGCGSGLSGQVIAEHGHAWVGLDISPSMLNVAQQVMNEQQRRRSAEDEDDEEMSEEDDGDSDDIDEEDGIEENEENDEDEEEDDMDEEDDEDDESMIQIRPKQSLTRGTGDLLLHDMGQGINFRPNSFDGCISISAVQWLCYSYDRSQIPQRRLRTFFSSLYSVLRRGARAVIQLYPETPQQMEMITSAAMGAGFTGGVVVDYPNSAKAKKFYLVLFAGGSASSGSNQLPRGLGSSSVRPQTSVEYEKHRGGKSKQGRVKKRDSKNQPSMKSRDWIVKKKDRQRKQGREVRPDSKFTGRKRKGGF